MNNLKIIIASTREGRKGPAIADWFYKVAETHPEFQIEVIDLAQINLPFMDEPHHPRLRKYEHQHTKDWSAIIEPADAFVVVLPEYNYGFPATIKNALDFLFNEWAYKPIAFVSYGGVSAGTRAVQMLKQVLAALKMVPLVESVHIPMFAKHIDDQGKFNSEEGLDKSAHAMLTELARWSEVLKPMREKK
jgi:NAD(P)H-dependent FMN reductase